MQHTAARIFHCLGASKSIRDRQVSGIGAVFDMIAIHTDCYSYDTETYIDPRSDSGSG